MDRRCCGKYADRISDKTITKTVWWLICYKKYTTPNSIATPATEAVNKMYVSKITDADELFRLICVPYVCMIRAANALTPYSILK